MLENTRKKTKIEGAKQDNQDEPKYKNGMADRRSMNPDKAVKTGSCYSSSNNGVAALVVELMGRTVCF